MSNGFDYASMGSNIARQLMGGQGAYENAYNKTSQTMADIAQKRAQAGYYTTKADAERQRASYQTPEYGLNMVAAMSGMTIPQVQAMQERQKTGSWGINPAYEDHEKSMTIAPTPKSAPDFATPENMGKFNNAMSAMWANLVGTGDSNAQQIAKAHTDFTDNRRISDALQNGGMGGLNALQAAMNGKMYDATTRGILSQENGVEDVNPLWADSEKARAQQHRASAASSYASAGQHKAQTDKIRAEIEAEKNGGKPPQGYRWGSDGNLEAIPGGPADKKNGGKEPTEAQSTSAGFAARMVNSDKILNELDGKYSLVGANTGSGSGITATISNFLNSDETQKVTQAQRDFVNAVLRKESGAVISDEEFANAARQYFPQPGDSKAVILQKATNRTQAIKNIKMSAGNAWDDNLPLSNQDQKKEAPPKLTVSQRRESVIRARQTIAKSGDNPRVKQAAIQMLEDAGIMNHGIR